MSSPLSPNRELYQGANRSGSHRHRQSLVNLVPPHQRTIGLCRLKSSLCATIALPDSVSDNRLRLSASSRPRWLLVSSVRSPSSRPATAGRGPCASPSSREPISEDL